MKTSSPLDRKLKATLDGQQGPIEEAWYRDELSQAGALPEAVHDALAHESSDVTATTAVVVRAHISPLSRPWWRFWNQAQP
jgi:hypothetical protein